jgi:hypothetical protein
VFIRENGKLTLEPVQKRTFSEAMSRIRPQAPRGSFASTEALLEAEKRGARERRAGGRR